MQENNLILSNLTIIIIERNFQKKNYYQIDDYSQIQFAKQILNQIIILVFGIKR
jgi:hypothetical protein